MNRVQIMQVNRFKNGLTELYPTAAIVMRNKGPKINPMGPKFAMASPRIVVSIPQVL